MKKTECGRKFLLLLAFAFALVLGALFACSGAAFSVTADAAGAYDYTITDYTVQMTIADDREIKVKEVVTASFTGYDSHGIIRDFALGGGVRYQDITAKCNSSDFSPYTQSDSASYLSLYLRGDGKVTGQSRTYTISYTMIVPALSEEGYLPLDVIGYGWQTTISNVSVTVDVPEGLSDYKVYSGSYGTSFNSCGATVAREGNTLTITADYLGYENGITLDLSFSAGVLSTTADLTVIFAVVLGAILVLAAVAVKFIVCRQPEMVRPVSLEAPDAMDPLKMGKLIDNKVDGEDMGALIFWFADQGYLTIDMTESEENPVLIKTEKPFPSDAPAHLCTMYEGLFHMRESVRISDLNNSFYQTASSAKLQVSAAAGNFYDKKSKVLIGLFAVLTVLLLGGFAYIYPLITVYASYHYWYLMVACAAAFAIAAFGSNLAKQREQKWRRALLIFVPLGCLVLALVPFVAVLIFPSPAFGTATGVLLVAFAALTGCIVGSCLCRTKEYSQQLGMILGFKQFIEFTERDKIEFMLKENPELYYHILPYAQVLGVTDAWTEKFKGLDMPAPSYARYNTVDFVVDCMMWNAIFRSLNGNMARNMVSSPSSSGKAGGHGGGFGGGFGGGGFGGGGGRGC